jgi:hypothetical protein
MIRTKRLEKKLEELEEDEHVIRDSKISVACFDLEELIRDRIVLFKDIVRLDQHVCMESFKEPEKFHQDIESQIQMLFSRWCEGTGQILAVFSTIREVYDSTGFGMVHVDELESQFKTCSALLNPSNVETHLADEAIDQHRKGQTIPM